MTKFKVQINSKVQMLQFRVSALITINPERVELQDFELWHSFDIWILNFDISIYSFIASIASMI